MLNRPPTKIELALEEEIIEYEEVKKIRKAMMEMYNNNSIENEDNSLKINIPQHENQMTNLERDSFFKSSDDKNNSKFLTSTNESKSKEPVRILNNNSGIHTPSTNK
jgi:hypothetical protein